MSGKKTVVQKARVGSDGTEPFVGFGEKVVINLGDYSSLGIEVNYGHIRNEEDLERLSRLLPKVIVKVDGDMGDLVQEALGEGVREDLRIAVLALVADRAAAREKEKGKK